MEYRNMGRCGLKVSALSLGAWVTFGDQIEATMASDLIHRAYDAGVNFFDNADIYANGKAEEVMGAAIKDLRRESLVISSKVFWSKIFKGGRLTVIVATPSAISTMIFAYSDAILFRLSEMYLRSSYIIHSRRHPLYSRSYLKLREAPVLQGGEESWTSNTPVPNLEVCSEPSGIVSTPITPNGRDSGKPSMLVGSSTTGHWKPKKPLMRQMEPTSAGTT